MAVHVRGDAQYELTELRRFAHGVGRPYVRQAVEQLVLPALQQVVGLLPDLALLGLQPEPAQRALPVHHDVVDLLQEEHGAVLDDAARQVAAAEARSEVASTTQHDVRGRARHARLHVCVPDRWISLGENTG